MRTHIASFCLVLMLLSLCTPSSPVRSSTQGYLDPALRAARTPDVAVIVTASSDQEAAAAVQQVGGHVTSNLWLIDGVAATLPAAAVARLSALPGVQAVVANRAVHSSDWDGWVTDLPLPDRWDGRPDVQPTDNPLVWKLVNPVAIDVGADQLQRSGQPKQDAISGRGVTVAVVDSGVYVDAQVHTLLSTVVQRQFLGQANFVNPVCGREVVKRRERMIGEQRPDHCWLNHDDSADEYGHGTAVASIIWNNFTDQATGVSLGIAPRPQF